MPELRKRKHDDPVEAEKKISNSDDDLFLVYEKKEFSKAIFHLGILKDKRIILIDLVNIDGQLKYLNRSIGFSGKNVKVLENIKSLNNEHFNNLKSNILVLNKLEIGDTIQWPLGSFSFAYHRAIITGLNIEPEIIHLYQLDGASSSTGSTSASATFSTTASVTASSANTTSASTTATSAASYAAVCYSGVNGKVCKENLLDYVYKMKFSIFMYEDETFSQYTKRSPDEIVEKANELLGPAFYNLPTNNCQNFCNLCTFSDYVVGTFSDGVQDFVNMVIWFAGGAILIFGTKLFSYLNKGEGTNKKQDKKKKKVLD